MALKVVGKELALVVSARALSLHNVRVFLDEAFVIGYDEAVYVISLNVSLLFLLIQLGLISSSHKDLRL